MLGLAGRTDGRTWAAFLEAEGMNKLIRVMRALEFMGRICNRRIITLLAEEK